MSSILPKKRSKNGAADRRYGSVNNNTVSTTITSSPTGMTIAGSNRVISQNRMISSSRHISRSLAHDVDDDHIDTSFDEGGGIRFNENKHTILSNFEEWIKMSTDNKITSKNSWQFALIDYFHDLNVIKDGDNINFQRASATLDGCVKIYSSRVESAASETGKLLSGLSTKKNEMENEQNEDDDEDEDGEDDEDEEGVEGGAQKTQGESNEDKEVDGDERKKRKTNKSVDSTLVEFKNIRIKKLEQELAIDPLFKKALAEFDEGGAKCLLLNTLNIDSNGRVVFDATTNPHKDEADEEEEDRIDQQHPISNPDINIDSLKHFIFKNEQDSLDQITICPSLDEFHSAIDDVGNAKSILNDFNTKMNDTTNQEILGPSNVPSSDEFENDNDMGSQQYGDDFYDDINDNDDSHSVKDDGESVLHKLLQGEEDSQEVEIEKYKVMDEDLMAYFDERMKSNWRGPEHWKVAAFKKSRNLDQQEETNSKPQETGESTASNRKKKAQILVDFFNEEEEPDEDVLFAIPKTAASLHKKPQSNRSNILPDDIKYSSARLITLFTKPQIPIMKYIQKKKQKPDLTTNQIITDENYFAQQYQIQDEEQEADERERERLAHSFHQAENEDYNNDFGGIDFNDAFGSTSGEVLADIGQDMDMEEGGGDGDDGGDGAGGDEEPAVSTQVETAEPESIMGRRRPEYVNFSRVAKRVDVKLLKDNLWNAIVKSKPKPAVIEEVDNKTNDEQSEEPEMKEEKIIQFGDIIQSINRVYKPEQAKDISTSYCFICLLHLANEHGLKIIDNETHNDLKIKGF
ncbi:BRN1 [[Candida] subhashii]|uniref:Condensin complex subunit 2 n=1 Tax=[Candida] subhashii TaxID=561895 RepID=A0A8J5QH03_9ASCO|nr:BRN1 [[Candida] subhashii]KAG7661944.1 BRN1 [[Candida] subhashii]